MNNRLLSLQCVCSKSWITTSPCELYTLHVGSWDSLNKARTCTDTSYLGGFKGTCHVGKKCIQTSRIEGLKPGV